MKHRFITVLSRTCHWSSWARWIQSICSPLC